MVKTKLLVLVAGIRKGPFEALAPVLYRHKLEVVRVAAPEDSVERARSQRFDLVIFDAEPRKARLEELVAMIRDEVSASRSTSILVVAEYHSADAASSLIGRGVNKVMLLDDPPALIDQQMAELLHIAPRTETRLSTRIRTSVADCTEEAFGEIRRIYEFAGWELTDAAVSSAKLACELAIGLVGIGRVGFDILAVCRAIRVVLGFDREYEAVLVGTGHLGTALAEYSGFARYGLRIVAAFDNDQNRVGGEIAGCKIRSTMLMKSCIRKGNIRLAILTTPAEASQGLADRLVSAGVKAIWNFSPTRLTVPSDVLVRNEHISIGLSQIAYHLKQME